VVANDRTRETKNAQILAAEPCRHDHAGDHRAPGSGHPPLDQALERRRLVAAASRLRDALPGHQYSLALDGRRGCGPYLSLLAYLPPGPASGRAGPKERGTIAIFYRAYSKEVEDRETGLVQDETRRVLKSFTVFNACQIDGLPERYFPAPRPLPESTARDLDLDMFFTSIPARLRHHGSEAYYEPVADRITMPDPSAFQDLDHYRATLAHELSHWTGHDSRLARSLAGRFGSDAYAVEELIAELAAAMLGAELGLPVAHLDHHASYLASWLKVLKSDSRAILTAAAKAEEACNLLLRLGGRVEEAADGLEDAPRLAA
jgi:antirestriction protein ArdC